MLIIVVVISGALPELSPLCPRAVPTSRVDKEKPCFSFCPVDALHCVLPARHENYTMDRRKTQGGALTLKRTGVLIECVPAGYALPLSAVELCLLMVMVSNFLIPTNEECTKLCRLIVTRTTPPQNWGRSLNPKLDSPTGGRIFRFFRS